MDLIQPITGMIDKAEELLGHSPHPAIVSLPVGAWSVSNICDTVGLISGREQFDDAARISMAIGLVGAAGAAVTGLRDYSNIPKSHKSHGTATSHAIGNLTATSLMAVSYALRARSHARGERTCATSRVLGLLGGGLAMYSAWLGGVLVQEFGESVKPVMEQEAAEEYRNQSIPLTIQG